MNSNLRLWRWFFVLAALEAGAAFVALLLVPHEAGGYSISRLALLLLLAIAFCAAVLAAIRFARRGHILARPRNAWASFAISLVLIVALFLLRYQEPDRLLAYYARLSPLLWYLLAVSVEFPVFCLLDLHGIHPRSLAAESGTWRAGLIALVGLLAVLVFVVVTRIGLTPDSAYWGEPGVPILGWQLSGTLLLGAFIFAVSRGRIQARWIDWAVVLAIWGVAVILWLSVPVGVMKNSFYAPINPPTNQPFPNSDAGYYDAMAQSLLIGYPYQGDIPTRPLYITFLAFLHLVAGQNYNLMIAGQTLLLAAIPFVLYLLGKRLHSRVAGIMVAAFAIFREWNSLLVSSQTRVSNTKTLLVDMPTLLLMLLACLFVLAWLQRRDNRDALLAGGTMGILLLLRTQSLVILPIVLAVAIIAMGFRNRGTWTSLGLFAAAFAAAVVPWLVHNYLHSGQITLDAPFEYQVIASQYKYTGNLDLGAVNLNGKSLVGILLTFAAKDPGFVAWFISTHFLATMIDSLLALPLAARFDGLSAPLYLYWMNWTTSMSAANIALLLGYLVVIALGLGAAWRRLRWAGLVPLEFGVGYALANGIARFSGWRYDLPADWVAYFYFAAGAAEVFTAVRLLFKSGNTGRVADKARPAPALRWHLAAVLLPAFALLGALPWMAEGLAAPRYASQSLSDLVDQLAGSKAVQALQISAVDIQDFTGNPQATLQIGRVLYPRFFTRGDGLPSSHPWPAYAMRDFARMGFLLLNQSRHDAVMALRQPGPGFSQGSDAIILGCQRENYIEVRLILFTDTGTVFQSAPLTQTCN